MPFPIHPSPRTDTPGKTCNSWLLALRLMAPICVCELLHCKIQSLNSSTRFLKSFGMDYFARPLNHHGVCPRKGALLPGLLGGSQAAGGSRSPGAWLSGDEGRVWAARSPAGDARLPARCLPCPALAGPPACVLARDGVGRAANSPSWNPCKEKVGAHQSSPLLPPRRAWASPSQDGPVLTGCGRRWRRRGPAGTESDPEPRARARRRSRSRPACAPA